MSHRSIPSCFPTPVRIPRARTAAPVLAVLVGFAAAGHERPVPAATISWDGDTSTAWATGGNWSGGTAPADDTVTDLAAFAFAVLPAFQPNAGTRGVAGVVLGDGTTPVPAFTIAGTGLSIGASGIVKLAASGSVTLSAATVLAAAQTWTNESAGVLAVTGAVAADGHAFSVAGSGPISVTGVISGSAGLAKSGGGTLGLSADNTFTGSVLLGGGVLEIAANRRKEPLGPDTNAVTFTGSGATLRLVTDIDRSARPYVFLQPATFDTNGHALTLGGTLSGTAGLVKTGAGVMTLEAANTFTGTAVIQSGTLQLSGGAAIVDTNAVVLADAATALVRLAGAGETIGSLAGGGAAGGNVDLDGQTLAVGGAGSSTSFGGRFLGSNSSQVRTFGSGTLTLTNTSTNDAFTGTVRIDGGALSIAAVESLGQRGTNRYLFMNDGGTLVTTADLSFNTRRFDLGSTAGTGIAGVFDVLAGSTTALRAIVSGTGGLRKTGGGTLRLADTAKAYTGPTQVAAGTLAVDTTIASGVTVAAGGTLSGTGTLAAAAVIAGLHSPGSSPGIQSFSSNLTYDAGAALLWELIASSTASRGTAFDGVDVSGTLDFPGATWMRLSFDAAGSAVDWNDPFWNDGHSWLVYDVAGSTSGVGNLSVQTADWLDGSGGRFDTIRPGSGFAVRQTGQDVELVYAVPEPSAALPVLVTGAALLFRQRARRRDITPARAASPPVPRDGSGGGRGDAATGKKRFSCATGRPVATPRSEALHFVSAGRTHSGIAGLSCLILQGDSSCEVIGDDQRFSSWDAFSCRQRPPRRRTRRTSRSVGRRCRSSSTRSPTRSPTRSTAGRHSRWRRASGRSRSS